MLESERFDNDLILIKFEPSVIMEYFLSLIKYYNGVIVNLFLNVVRINGELL